MWLRNEKYLVISWIDCFFSLNIYFWIFGDVLNGSEIKFKVPNNFSAVFLILYQNEEENERLQGLSSNASSSLLSFGRPRGHSDFISLS